MQHLVTFQNSFHADGGLIPGSAHTGPSAQTPIDTSGNFPVHVSAELPSTISPVCLELISKVSENFKKFKKNLKNVPNIFGVLIYPSLVSINTL